MVTLADKIWKGARVDVLELKITQHIAQQSQQETWAVYMRLDDLIGTIAEASEDRLNWQAQYAV